MEKLKTEFLERLVILKSFYFDSMYLYGAQLKKYSEIASKLENNKAYFKKKNEPALKQNPESNSVHDAKTFFDMEFQVKGANFTFTFGEQFQRLLTTTPKMLSYSFVVMTYQIWEDEYRKKIAERLGLDKKNDLKSDIFGDIRHYRTSIVHKNGKAVKECSKCKILKPFGYNEEIIISNEDIKLITSEIELYINGLGITNDSEPK